MFTYNMTMTIIWSAFRSEGGGGGLRKISDLSRMVEYWALILCREGWIDIYSDNGLPITITTILSISENGSREKAGITQI